MKIVKLKPPNNDVRWGFYRFVSVTSGTGYGFSLPRFKFDVRVYPFAR